MKKVPARLKSVRELTDNGPLISGNSIKRQEHKHTHTHMHARAAAHNLIA